MKRTGSNQRGSLHTWNWRRQYCPGWAGYYCTAGKVVEKKLWVGFSCRLKTLLIKSTHRCVLCECTFHQSVPMVLSKIHWEHLWQVLLCITSECVVEAIVSCLKVICAGVQCVRSTSRSPTHSKICWGTSFKVSQVLWKMSRSISDLFPLPRWYQLGASPGSGVGHVCWVLFCWCHRLPSVWANKSAAPCFGFCNAPWLASCGKECLSRC